MEKTLLFVLHAVPSGDRQVDALLRMARQARPLGSRHSLLLFCDLPDAGAAVLPGDAPMLRRLQSGMMAMNGKSGGFLFLARKRTWDDAQRAYLGQNQRVSCRQVIAQLLLHGKTDAAFDAATVSPASLKGRFSHVLFSDAALFCTPDTPERMMEALDASPYRCIGAHIWEKKSFPQTALARLCAAAPFSLSPLLGAKNNRLLGAGHALPDAPMLCVADMLESLPDASSIPAAAGCFFVRRQSRSLSGFFAAHRQFCLHAPLFHVLLSPLQVVMLFLSAAFGLPLLAALAIFPAELWTFLHPRLLPGALLRLSLLPVTACVSLDALLCRLFARSRLLRLRVPDLLITPQGCLLFGATLLPAALFGAQALASLLPVALLWLAAPLIIPAADAPTLERIPLSADQRKQIRSLAESAFWESETHSIPPPMRLLADCCGCMLALLEPDEAARRIEKQLSSLSQDALPAAGFAAMLCAAQYLRERMADCDAALRSLPSRIEAAALACPLQRSPGRLNLFLSAAKGELSSFQAAASLKNADISEPLDLLFLPLESAKASPVYPLSLPLTHPHTYLRRQLLASDAPVFLPAPALRVLFLTAAANDHPFCALLERSPVTGPYMPLLSV